MTRYMMYVQYPDGSWHRYSELTAVSAIAAVAEYARDADSQNEFYIGVRAKEIVEPNPEQLAALRRFAARHGRCWKKHLRDVWSDDPVIADSGLLRQLRNELGPRWLEKYRLEKP